MIAVWILLIYMTVMSMTAFAAFGVDKYKAIAGKWRIPERTLFLLALLGGGVGAFLGMKFFHHKTLHPKFILGIPAIMAVQLILTGWFLWKMIA